MKNKAHIREMQDRLEKLTGKRIVFKEYYFDNRALETGKTLKMHLWEAFVEGYVKSGNDKLDKYITSVWVPRIKPLINKISDDLKVNAATEKDLDMPTLWLETSDAFDMAEYEDYSGIDQVLQELQDWLERFTTHYS